MPMLGSYIFKPRYDAMLSEKIINGFLNDFCDYENAGFYTYWHNATKDLPSGYVQFSIETDNGDLEQYSEMSFEDTELTAEQLTRDMYVLLGQDFWHKDDDDNTIYSFEERELCEVVSCLAVPDSRVISSSGDAQYAHVREATADCGWKRVSTVDFLLNAPLENLAGDSHEQLSLPTM